MEPDIDLQEEIAEGYLLLQDSAESVALDAPAMKQTVGQGYKIFSFTVLGYLLLNLLSRRTPGPAHWLALDQHTQLFHRISSLF